MLKTNDGDVLITTDGKKATADGYRNIIIASNADGAEVTLGDIAEVTDNRNSYVTQASFDRRASVSLDVFRVGDQNRSEEHTSELQSRPHLVCRLLLEKKNNSI